MAKFTFFGGMAMLVERSDGFRILLDPYLSGNPATRTKPSELYGVDLILVTHAAFDHFGDTVELMQHSGAKLMCGSEVFGMVRRAADIDPARHIGTIYGDERRFGETVVRTVQAWHGSGVSIGEHRFSYYPYGFIVQLERGVTYYHTGDTYLFSDMKMIRELYKPNVMVAGISKISEPYPCEMNAREAAQMVGWIGPDVVVPCHYAPGDPALERFMQYAAAFAPYTVVRPEVDKTFEYRPFSVI